MNTITRLPFTAEELIGVDEFMEQTANQFRTAFTLGGLMTLGADAFKVVPGQHQLGGLCFTARILPMDTPTTRKTRPVKMAVMVSLTWADEIDVEVRELNTGNTHARIPAVYISDLQKIAFALDYDGPEVLNPRYWPN